MRYSVQLEILQVLGQADVRGAAQWEAAFASLSSLAFLVPALACWRMGRTWHTFMFVLLAVTCSSCHFCAAPSGFGVCSSGSADWFSALRTVWGYFCLLQTALAMLGPEDPQLHTPPQDGHSPTALLRFRSRSRAPLDVVVLCRVVPLVLLGTLNLTRRHAAWVQVQWDNMLLVELLLVACTSLFWTDLRRRPHAAALLRLKYWSRLLHHGLVPAAVLFWLFCFANFAGHRSLTPLMHVVVAGYAASAFKAAHPDPAERPTCADVLDTSVQSNPHVSHALTASVAIVLVPSLLVGSVFDWCGQGTPASAGGLAAVIECEQGGHFVAFAGVAACSAACGFFLLLDSVSSRTTVQWMQLAGGSRPWDAPEEDASAPGRGAPGRRLGCLLGFAGAACALLAALAAYDSPRHGALAQGLSVLSMIVLGLAMALTTASSEPNAPCLRLRRFYTALVCEPLVLLNVLRVLSGAALPLEYAWPGWASDYMAGAGLVVLSLWPLTWAAEVQKDCRLKVDSTFAWPKTDWRFQ